MAVPVEEPSTSNSRPVSNGVHYLAKCVLRGSAVLQVVRGHIRSSDFMDVVFGKVFPVLLLRSQFSLNSSCFIIGTRGEDFLD